MKFTPDELDASQTLAGLEAGVRRRRAAEVDDLLLVAHWSDLHSADPRDDAGATRVPGADRLDHLGGDGTPGVQELALCELGVARQVHPLAARAVTADVLDLRHRLPHIFSHVLDLEAEPWLARKVARMSRHLPLEVMPVVDRAVADAIVGSAPSRVLAVAEAKIIEADTQLHEERMAAERNKRFVALSRSDGSGLRNVIARVTSGDALWVDAMVERVAEILASRPENEGTTRDVLRSQAFGWLARPVDLLALLLEHGEHASSYESTTGPEDLAGALSRLDPAKLRPRAVVYVHVHEAALAGMPGVARVEGLGPHTLQQVRDLLGHAFVAVKPVVDLQDHISVNSYEHPEALKERIHLIRPGDAFPHASRVTRNVDIDHPLSYDPDGPPDQTSSRTSQPLTRTVHRAKTHLGYTAIPLETGEVVWRTPHGLHRVVDAFGTHVIDESEAAALTGDDPLDRALVRLLIHHRTGRAP